MFESQRWRLLAATAELLAEGGYRDLTSHGIARRASVSSQAFYVHFGGLDDCMLACFESTAHSVELSAARGCEGAGGPEAAIAAAVGEMVALLARDPPLARLLSVEARAPVPGVGEAFARLVERLAGRLAHATEVSRRGPARARLVVRGLLGALSDASPADLAPPSRLADQLTALICSGCAPPRTPDATPSSGRSPV